MLTIHLRELWWLMMTWLLMLITQPIFIVTGRIRTHRAISKLAYIIGPMITIYLFLIAQEGYHRGADNPEIARAIMVLDLRGLFFFTILYVLALSYRKTTAYHMRFYDRPRAADDWTGIWKGID